MTSAVRVPPRSVATAPRPQSPGRMQIDWTRCDGHGLCAALLPGAVTRDEWGYPVVDDLAVDEAPATAVNRAVTACPALALRRADR